jgi:hypothetical protein
MRRLIALALIGLALAVPARAMIFTGTLTGTAEVPPNDSPGTGSVTVDMDVAAHTLRIQASWAGLLSPTTVAHIHCCTTPSASPATMIPSFTDFPVGVMSGSYDMTFDTLDAATWNGAFVTANGGTAAGAETAFFDGLMAGNAYFNIHTGMFPAGELRANLAPIPEPSSYALLLAGLAAVGGMAARRRR